MSAMVEGKQEDEENLKKEVEKVILGTVGEADYDTDKATNWSEIMLAQIYKLTKKDGYKSAVLVEILPRKTDVLRRTKFLSIPGTDIVTMIEKKTEKVNVMVFIAMMKYD
mmetsp:Transcript_1687/g.2433  ORF Transcript_1687/g.2433 Transcript_1687/m.2433 type:complete len:110 (-) Transcript_1687:151-480(-)|eukprot:CAMPEP_0185263660 /NCGR_PEP_ID=MMETSP1359-20130426/15508_1 /TAXON_ID=552665 /ORGANISM="Bigelowiella longifila, Strain CCMP242" /LENGTH=109 /DNA_ID=CAMNT_0027851329 /DNA_START=84 /DNA_END=413 /DNA_ORIENTATION=+